MPMRKVRSRGVQSPHRDLRLNEDGVVVRGADRMRVRFCETACVKKETVNSASSGEGFKKQWRILFSFPC